MRFSLHTILGLFQICTLVLAAAHRASACECAGGDGFQGAIRKADIIVVGTVISAGVTRLPDGSWTMPMRVSTVFRGKVPEGGLVIGADKGGGCGIQPEFLIRDQPDGQHFAFALRSSDRLPSGAYVLHWCPWPYAMVVDSNPPGRNQYFDRRYSLEEIRLLALGKFKQVESEAAYRRRLEESPSPVPAEALDFPLHTYDGNTVKLREYSGQVVVVCNWYERCGKGEDCSLLRSLVEMHKTHRRDPLRIIGMPPFSPQTEVEEARGLAKKLSIEFPLVWAASDSDIDFLSTIAEYEKFGFMAFPQCFVISSDGNIVKRARRGNEAAVVKKAVQKALSTVRRTGQ